MSLGSEIVMLMTLQGELPGRPEGEKVLRLVISQGFRARVAVASGVRQRRQARSVLGYISGDGRLIDEEGRVGAGFKQGWVLAAWILGELASRSLYT